MLQLLRLLIETASLDQPGRELITVVMVPQYRVPGQLGMADGESNKVRITSQKLLWKLLWKT